MNDACSCKFWLKRGNDEDNHPAKDTRERSGLCLRWHPRLCRASGELPDRDTLNTTVSS